MWASFVVATDVEAVDEGDPMLPSRWGSKVQICVFGVHVRDVEVTSEHFRAQSVGVLEISKHRLPAF